MPNKAVMAKAIIAEIEVYKLDILLIPFRSACVNKVDAYDRSRFHKAAR